MKATRKLSPVQEAYICCKPARDVLVSMDARCMEATEDKAGILWERWIVETTPPLTSPGRHVQVILFATPDWWEVFTPVTEDRSIEGTLKSLRVLKEG